MVFSNIPILGSPRPAHNCSVSYSSFYEYQLRWSHISIELRNHATIDVLKVLRQAVRRPGKLNLQAVEELSIKSDHRFYSNRRFVRISRLRIEEYHTIYLLARIKPYGFA